ncbi:TonB-dependent siderophore receptor [Vibrio sp. S17_S38]|uniref:TonB-dependent siderophore receptor n=1 Tax=Vibrio sp. S17_S38 TaxID=2720229 RepID=UPI001680A45E|nr:TonB-dependent siderophore receptor [Vibrio sp. S17_S38]MBD1574280.1 TonB-dependent siderophore receptor [Vibrio sp. S17_S38]
MPSSTSQPFYRVSPIAFAIASILFTSSLMAEENNNTTVETNQENLTVLGQMYRNTATKTSLQPEETPQAITVIDSNQMDIRGAETVQQALRYAPGVNAELKGGSVSMYDNYNIRGFDNNQMYYDGLVLQYLVGWNLQPQIDPIALERVEVFKGPSSVLYGSMPPGGMVNLMAKAPQKQSNTDVSVSTGTGNLTQATIDTTGQFGASDVYYRLVAKARKKDGQVNYTEEERYVIAPSIDWYVTDSTLINFNFYYQNDPSMGMNSAMPASGSVFDNPNGSIDKDTYMGDKNWSDFEREFWMAGYKIDHSFSDNWSFLQNARFMKADLYQENTYHSASGWDPTTGNLDRYIYSTDEESKGFTIDNQLSGKFATGSVDHNVLLGVDYQYLKGSSNYTSYGYDGGYTAPSFNAFAPNNNQIDRSKVTEAGVYIDDIKVEQLGLYLQDQMRINKVVLIASGRFDNYQSTSDYAGTKTDIDQNNFSYRVGALYEFDSGWSPYINYATSFEPVAGADASGKVFDPSIGQQVEGGVKYLSADYATSLTASVFHIVKSDVVVADPNDPTYQDKMQIGEVRSQGVELEGRFALTANWNVNVGYAYTDMEVTKDTTGLEGNAPIYVPKHAASLWTDYYLYNGLLAGTRLSGGVRYIGEREMDAANTDKVPDYTLVDLSAGYDLSNLSDNLQGAQVSVSANNIFDTDNFTCYDSTNCWYGQERTVELKFDYNF